MCKSQQTTPTSHPPLSSSLYLQVVREASKRVLGLRPFDVQLVGGMILHEGQIAEMRTGEGKTLVAVLPAYLNALTGGCAAVASLKQVCMHYKHLV